MPCSYRPLILLQTGIVFSIFHSTLKPECKVIYVTPKFISSLLVHCLDFNIPLLLNSGGHVVQEADSIARYRGGSMATVICSEVGLWFNLSHQNEFPGLYLDIVADTLSSAG